MSSARPVKRFSGRVFLIAAVMLLVVSAVYTAYFVLAQRRQMEAALTDRGRVLGGLLATGGRTAVFAESGELVRETLSGVVGRRAVLSAAVFTLEGRPIAAGGRSPALQGAAGQLEPEDLAVVRRLGPENGCLEHWGEKTLDTFCSVLLRERGTATEDLHFEGRQDASDRKAIGFVRVTQDRAPLRREIAGMLLRSLGLMAVVLLLGGWAGHRFARRVSEPLERLTEAVRVYGAGGEIGGLSRMPDNEVGRLAEAFTAMTRDLAERERARELLAERLRHAQKMEAVGALSQGIAHDFKNFLSTLVMSVYLLKRCEPENESVLKYTGRMRAVLERAQELVERLLTFSRTRELRREAVDLAALVGKLAPSIGIALGEQVRLNFEPPGHPVSVCGDPASLDQLLMNLAYNARDAMPDGGVLCVRLGIHAGASGETPMARISVQDTGVGMSPEMRSRIFESFFTTKGPGSGVGLGLSIVRGIVDEHRGRIQVESEPGEGTTFHVDLPLVAPSEAPGGPQAAGGAGGGG